MDSAKLAVEALYYPYIHFQSVDWLKAALLYWERIQRIVPHKDFVTDDPPEVRDLVAEGLVINVPAHGFTTEAAERFTPRLETLLESRGAQLSGTAEYAATRARNSRDQDAHIAVMKLDEALARRLEQSNLAYREGEWYRVSEETAGLYMMALAGVISDQRNSPVVTEHFECEVASLFFNTSAGTLEQTGDGYALARLLCPVPEPGDLSNVSMDKVLSIRERFDSQRRRFRRELQSLADEIGVIDNPEALEPILHDARSRIADQITGHKQAIDELGVGTLWNLLSLSVPTSVTGVGAALGLAPVSLAIFGGVALTAGLLNWWGQRRGRARELRQSPWHYLLSLEKAVDVSSRYDGFREGMRQLVYD